MAISLFSQGAPGSAWKQMESWRAKQKQNTADFEAFNGGLVSTLANVFSSANDGGIEITVRKAMAAAKVRAAARAKQNGVDQLI